MRIELAFPMLLVLVACGGGGNEATAQTTTTPKVEAADPDEPAIQSNDILARDQVTKKAKVKHILIGWKDLSKNYQDAMDPRAKNRTRAEADDLAQKLLARVRAGEDVDALMEQYSEDTGSAKSAAPYDVSVDAQLVFSFKRLSLRLNVGEAGLVQTIYGWHIIKRIE